MGDGFLRTTISWVVGFAFAVVFFFLAYLYFEIAVVLAMSFIGFTIGVAVMSAFGVTWNWVLVVAGLALGVVLAVVAVRTNLPMGVLIVLTAVGGASTIVAGTMLLVGTVNVDEFDNRITTKDLLDDNPWWYFVYGALVIAGIIAQLAFAERVRQTLREAWTDAGGKHLSGV